MIFITATVCVPTVPPSTSLLAAKKKAFRNPQMHNLQLRTLNPALGVDMWLLSSPASCGRGSLMHSWTFGTAVTTITAAPVCNSDRAKERPVSFNNICGQKRPFISPASVLTLTADTRGGVRREQRGYGDGRMD